MKLYCMMLRSVVAHVLFIQQIAQPANVRRVLADELVHEAAGAELQFGIGQVLRAHPAVAQAGSDGGRVFDRPNLVLVVRAVEQAAGPPRRCPAGTKRGSARRNRLSPKARAISSAARKAPRYQPHICGLGP